MKEVKRLSRTLVYHGAILDVYKDHVITPRGNEADWDFIGHKGAAACVAVADDGRLLMVKQYRNALDRFTLEIPAGGLESVNEDPKVAAARELEEETGYRSDDLEYLITVNTTIAFCNEKIPIYLAKNLQKTSQHLDADEEIEVIPMTVEELKELIFAGKLTDGKTVAAIMSYAARLS